MRSEEKPYLRVSNTNIVWKYIEIDIEYISVNVSKSEVKVLEAFITWCSWIIRLVVENHTK